MKFIINIIILMILGIQQGKPKPWMIISELQPKTIPACKPNTRSLKPRCKKYRR
jgi:hypothetical protein